MYIYVFNYYIYANSYQIYMSSTNLSSSLNAYFQLSAKHHLDLLHWIYFKLNRSKSELIIFTNVLACLTVFYVLINSTKICSFSQTKNLGDLYYFNLSASYT